MATDAAAPFTVEVPVRYLEVDQQGVVFNMWYLAYFDDAMTAFLASNGLQYTDLIAAGYDVQLVHSEIDWTGGLRWGDTAAIAVACTATGRSSFTLTFTVVRAATAEPVATGRTVYVTVALPGGVSAPIPDVLRRGLGA